jgi:tetratricopeptide (TPR) repeat protein
MSFRARRLHPWIGAPVAAAMALLACASVALAQPEVPVLAQILDLNRKAINDYDNLNFDEARTELKEALALCDRNGLGTHPVRARTYVNLGVVLLAADAAHREVAIAHFKRAFQIQPDVQLPARVANPEVAQAFAEAKRGMAADPAARSAATPGATAEPASTPGAVAPTAAPAASADATAPAAVHAAPSRPGARKVEMDADASKSDDDGSDGGAGPHWLFSVGIGSGFGWVSGSGEVNRDVKLPSGFEPSSVIHLAPEVGYFVRRDLALSLQARFQFISGTTPERSPSASGCGGDGVCSPSKGASALFAKATWFLGSGGLRPFVNGTIGYGQIRHVVTLPGHKDCGADPAQPVACVDTAAAGPVLLGGGGGVMVEVVRHFALTLGANALIGVSSFTAHLDFTAAVAVQL